MPLTNAERQARHRQRIKERLATTRTQWAPAPSTMDGRRGELLDRASAILRAATEADLDRLERTLATIEATQHGRVLAARAASPKVS